MKKGEVAANLMNHIITYRKVWTCLDAQPQDKVIAQRAQEQTALHVEIAMAVTDHPLIHLRSIPPREVSEVGGIVPALLAAEENPVGLRQVHPWYIPLLKFAR